MFILRLFSYILLLTVFLTVNVNDALASGKERVIIVFDASGSMAQTIKDGNKRRYKIDVARTVLQDLVSDWNPNVELGIMAYGHRQKGDCNDIQSVVPVGPLNKDKVNTAIKKLNPVGKTPLSKAVFEAAKELRYTEEKATVILISDGEETCDWDPCGTGTELKKLGVDFTAHAIGFNVGREAVKDLRCISENTGGLFLTAGNTKELNKAFKTVEKAVVKEVAPEPVPEPEPIPVKVVEPEPEPKPVVAANPGLKLSATLKEGGKILDKDLQYWIYKEKKTLEGTKREQVSYKSNPNPFVKLPAGKYIVYVKHGDIGREAEVEVKTGEFINKVIVLNGGYLRVNTKLSDGSDILDKGVQYWIYSQKKTLEGTKKEQVSYKSYPTSLFKLPSGKYIVYAKHGDIGREVEVEVNNEELTEKTMTLDGGYLRVNANLTEGGDILDKGMQYWVYREKKTLEGTKREQVSYKSYPTSLFKLPSGKYIVYAKHGDTGREAEVQVNPAELTEHTIDLKGGYLKVTASLKKGDAPIASGMQYWVYREKKALEGTKREQVSYKSYPTSVFKLPAGEYIIHAKHSNWAKDFRVEVKEGERTDANVILED